MLNFPHPRTLIEHRFLSLTVLYVLGDVAGQFALGRHHNVTGLLVSVPILVAFERRWRWTAASAGLVLVLMATSLFSYAAPARADVPVRLGALVAATAFGIYASAYLRRAQTSLVQTRAAAEAAQRAIIPVVPDRLGRLAFSSLYRSSAEESLVGGDFYKVIQSPWGTRMIVGDVEGKGLAAVSMSALVLGCFREWAPRLESVEDLVRILDERVGGYEERTAFVTAVVASIDDDLVLELANCGHLPPLLARDGFSTSLSPARPTTPLGLGSRPTIQRLVLKSGDRLFFYTDGLTETRTDQGKWIVLADVVTGLATDPFTTALEQIAGRLTAQGHLADDLAMLLVETSPQSGDGHPDRAGDVVAN